LKFFPHFFYSEKRLTLYFLTGSTGTPSFSEVSIKVFGKNIAYFSQKCFKSAAQRSARERFSSEE